MERNPFTWQFKSLSTTLAALDRERAPHVAELAWYAYFDGHRAQKSLTSQSRTVKDLDQQLSALSFELAEANYKTPELEHRTRLGWDPTYWFSNSRSQAKSRLADHRQALIQLETQYTNLRRRLSGAARGSTS